MMNFCVVSRRQINLEKSKAYFSKNVHFNRARDLSHELGIGITGDLGKYLGVHLMHKRVTKLLFQPILHKTQQKLSNWKGKMLTMAGQTVLIKAVLSAIPGYQMQTMLLPYGVLKDLEKISRTFLWNHTQDTRKMHLIS